MDLRQLHQLPEGQRFHEGPDVRDRASEIVVGIMVGVAFGAMLFLIAALLVLL